MSSTNVRARALIACVCAVLLAACGDGAQQQPTAAPKTPQAASKAAGLPPEMVAAVSAGKAATRISVHFALRGVPTIDQPLPVDIAIVPHVPFESVRVSFEARDGIKLTDAADVGPLTDVASEKPIKHRVSLLPLQEGMYMFTATVHTEGTEGSFTRVFSIPVVVPSGSAAAAPAAPAAPAPPIPAGESASGTPPAG
jgi:hypothetical protein